MDAEFQIFGSPGKDELRKWTYPYLEVLAEQVWKMNERKSGKRNFTSFGSKGSAEVRKRNFTTLKVPAVINAEVGLPILGSPGKISVVDERGLSKS